MAARSNSSIPVRRESLNPMIRRVAFTLITGLLAIANIASAAENPAAPPAVTARSWAIADADSGKLLWSHLPDEPRKAASTTKMMAAYVVLELARDAAILDEQIEASALAASTPGSVAGLRQGERIGVRDGLYALMLPSGNDMGNAFAEHFNSRFEAPGDETPENAKTEANATRVNFIAEMNRTARRLGMNDTHYRSPYGDGGTPEDRTTTARDLVTLAVAARRHPLFREVVATTDKAIRVHLPDGSLRRLAWANTNRLLEIDGYDGIKTGSTKLAENCLVASGTQGGRRFIVVTLGSSSDQSRFTDSKDLFRWASRQVIPQQGR